MRDWLRIMRVLCIHRNGCNIVHFLLKNVYRCFILYNLCKHEFFYFFCSRSSGGSLSGRTTKSALVRWLPSLPPSKTKNSPKTKKNSPSSARPNEDEDDARPSSDANENGNHSGSPEDSAVNPHPSDNEETPHPGSDHDQKSDDDDDETNRVASKPPLPDGEGPIRSGRNSSESTKNSSKSESYSTISSITKRRGRDSKNSKLTHNELKKPNQDNRTNKNISSVTAAVRRSNRGGPKGDTNSKKISIGLKKRSHSPSSREAGRSSKTRKSRSRVTSPTPTEEGLDKSVRRESETVAGTDRKGKSQSLMTEYYTIRKKKSTYKVIRTLPDDSFKSEDNKSSKIKPDKVSSSSLSSPIKSKTTTAPTVRRTRVSLKQ